MKLEELKRAGYCIVSRKHREAARIDREDWCEYCESKGIPVDAYYYRNCVSKDVVVVPQSFIGKLKNSYEGYKEFRKK